MGEGFLKHVLLFLFASTLVLHHFVNLKLTEIHWNIYSQFILCVFYLCFTKFGTVTTDVFKPLDILIYRGFFSCISWTKKYFCSYFLLWKMKFPHNRNLQNQLESVRGLLTLDQLILWLYFLYWLDMINFAFNKYIKSTVKSIVFGTNYISRKRKVRECLKLLCFSQCKNMWDLSRFKGTHVGSSPLWNCLLWNFGYVFLDWCD